MKKRFKSRDAMPSPGDFAQAIAMASRQIPAERIVKDMADLIKRMPLTDDEIKTLYTAIEYRMPAKSCVRCGKPTLIVHSVLRDFMGTSNRRICNACDQILKEKEAAS